MNGLLAVCFGQGLEERFCCVADGEVRVYDNQLPSLPESFIDAQSPWDAEVLEEVDMNACWGGIQVTRIPCPPS